MKKLETQNGSKIKELLLELLRLKIKNVLMENDSPRSKFTENMKN